GVTDHGAATLGRRGHPRRHLPGRR
ncbi:MAG: hypothetical protein AVDCRST_MAG76-972, partial [uncultured Acidimicrobiales bacterium]